MLKHTDALPRLRVPHPRRFVPTSREDASSVGAERHVSDLTCVAIESEEYLSLLCIPNLRRFVSASREDAPPVGSVLTWTSPSTTLATHSVALGQETPVKR